MSALPRHRYLVALGLATSMVFVVLTFRRVDVAGFAGHVRALPWIAFPAALAIKALGFWCAARRSRVLLAPVARLDTPRLFRSVLVAFVGNNVLPLRAGELMRGAYLARHGQAATSACLGVVALERLLDLACLGLLAVVLVPGAVGGLPADSGLYVLAVGATGALLGAVAASRWPDRLLAGAGQLLRPLPERVRGPLARELERGVEGLAALASPRAALASLLWTAGFWASMAAGVALWLAAFGLQLPAAAPALVLIFLAFGALLPSTPGQIGTYHWFAAAALGLLGVDPTRAAAFAVVLHFMAFVPFTLIGIALLLGEYLATRGDWMPGMRAP